MHNALSLPAPAADIVVERLARAQFRTVYPLMRQAAPSLSLARWLAYAGTVSRGGAAARRGVLVARRQAVAHPSGAVCYRRDSDMASGTLLTAEHYIAMDLLYPEAVLAALLARLESIAGALRCGAIRSIMHGWPPRLEEDLRAAGHSSDGVTFTKTLRP